MNYSNDDKQLLITNQAVTLSKLLLFDEEDNLLYTFTEDDFLVSWEYEDYRYVPNEGFIGQFTERLLDGNLLNIPDNITLENKELELQIGVKARNSETINYYSYGRFMITKIEKDDTSGNYKFESSDYAKKFNLQFNSSVVDYPCTALELLHSVCEQVDIEIDDVDNGCLIHVVGEEGLSANDYYFSNNNSFYKFTIPYTLKKNDSIIYNLSTDDVYIKHIADDYEMIRTTVEGTVLETEPSLDRLENNLCGYYDFINNDFVIEDNQFQESNSCRDVIRCIAKLGYTYARINENNKLCLDFRKKYTDQIDMYDIIGTNEYYTAKTVGDTTIPTNKIVVGMSNVDGENIVLDRTTDLLQLDKICGVDDEIPITGELKFSIIGDNLFDLNNADTINAYVNTQNSVVTSSVNDISIIFELLPNETYNITMKQLDSNNVVVTNDNVTYGLSTNEPYMGATLNVSYRRDNDNGDYDFNIETGNYKYLVLKIVNTTKCDLDNTLNTLKIRRGNESNGYSIYEEIIHIVDIGEIELYKDNNNVDYIHRDNGYWYIHKEVGETTETLITNNNLINQLNDVYHANLLKGTNNLSVTTSELKPYTEISIKDYTNTTTLYNGNDYIIESHTLDNSPINIYDNSLTHNEVLRRIAINGADSLLNLTYTPVDIESINHPWLTGKDYCELDNLSEETLYFYPFNVKLTYTGVLSTFLSSTSETVKQLTYENKDNIIYRMTKNEIDVDKANNRIDLLSQSVSDNTTNISNIQIGVSEINQSVEQINNSTIPNIESELSQVTQNMSSIQNLFQITGGANLINNSAFLLNDETWEFTDNGTIPYNTPFGAAYNMTVAGKTISISEIRLCDIIANTKSDNIINLRNDGTNYTLSFNYKTDDYTETIIRMYETGNSSNKAFNDITINQQTDWDSVEISFIPNAINYTLEIETSTTTDGSFYLYDLMLNSGEKQQWQPAQNEIYSTTLTMSKLGLKVYSVGDGTVTLLGSDGMITYESRDGSTLGNIVSQRTSEGDITRSNITQSIKLSQQPTNTNIDRWVTTVIQLGSSYDMVTYLEDGD